MQLRAVIASAVCALCVAGCVPPGAAPARAVDHGALLRVGIALEQDFAMVYGSGICDKDSQLSEGFACFRSNGTQYHGTPLRDEGANPSGIFPATTRLTVGLDRVLFERFAIGMRVGVVLAGGGPKPDGADAPPFLPLHVEGRAAY